MLADRRALEGGKVILGQDRGRAAFFDLFFSNLAKRFRKHLRLEISKVSLPIVNGA